MVVMNQTQTRPRRASSKRPSRPKPKGNSQPIMAQMQAQRSLANGRTVKGLVANYYFSNYLGDVVIYYLQLLLGEKLR